MGALSCNTPQKASHRAKTSCEMLYHNLLDCDRQLTVCGTRVLPAERIIPTSKMARPVPQSVRL